MLTCGESIEEALHLTYNLVLACDIQAKVMSVGLDNIYQMSKESVDQVRGIVKQPVFKIHGGGKSDDTETKAREEDGKEKLRKWKVWDLEFEAQMRMLDNTVTIFLPVQVVLTIFNQT